MNQALKRQDLSRLTRIAIGEMSSLRAHRYVMIIMDSEKCHVVLASPEKDASTVKAFAQHLATHQGKPEQIQEYCSDISAAFMSDMTSTLSQAERTIDNFLVMKMNNARVNVTKTLRKLRKGILH